MKNFFPNIWNTLHDGAIDAITGQVPGTVCITVSIEYLRERFNEPGDHFLITLSDCTLLTFTEYGSEDPITDMASISDLCPGILSAEFDDGICRVFADNGILRLQALAGTMQLDNGQTVTPDELCKVAGEYWDEWETKKSTSPAENDS